MTSAMSNVAYADPGHLAGRLAAWLTQRRAADDAAPSPEVLDCTFAGPVPTGNSNVTLPFTARCATGESLELVLRMQVPSNQIFFDADVTREHRVLRALHDEGTLPIPQPRWVEPDPGVLGQPFFVMSRIDGTVPAGQPSIHGAGWLADRTIAQRRAAWESAFGAMAAVTRVDWRSRLPFLAEGSSGTTIASRLDHLSEWYEWVVRGRAYPITDLALEFLRTQAPTDVGPPVMQWGDARPGNVMFGDDGLVAALLDWELASVGPPELDLGWWLALDEFATYAQGVRPLEGYPDRDETIETYERLTGRRSADVRWFEVLSAWVLTVTVIRMADISVDAGRLDPKNQMGHGNVSAQMLARWLGLPVPDLDPAYQRRRGLTTPRPWLPPDARQLLS